MEKSPFVNGRIEMYTGLFRKEDPNGIVVLGDLESPVVFGVRIGRGGLYST